MTLVEAAGHLLPAQPAPLGEAIGEVLRRDGATVILGGKVTGARRDGADYVLTLADSRELRGDRLLAATGRRPRLPGGLDTVGVTAGRKGIPVDGRLRAGERLWAIGDVTGLWLLTHVGKYQGEVVAANILGEPRARKRGSGCSRPPSPSAPAFPSPCCVTPSSRSPPSPRSTSTR